MRRLVESTLVHAPAGFALVTIEMDFIESGVDASLALRFPLPRAIVGGLTLEKRVALHVLSHARSESDRRIVVRWKPVDEPALPAFTGAILADETSADTCRLTIDGTYGVPGGPAGLIFDGLIGVRIARATLHALLERFGSRIEADYRARTVGR